MSRWQTVVFTWEQFLQSFVRIASTHTGTIWGGGDFLKFWKGFASVREFAKAMAYILTNTLSQRKGRAPQPSITCGEGWGQPARGVLHTNDNDDADVTPQGRFDLQSRSA